MMLLRHLVGQGYCRLSQCELQDNHFFFFFYLQTVNHHGPMKPNRLICPSNSARVDNRTIIDVRKAFNINRQIILIERKKTHKNDTLQFPFKIKIIFFIFT